MEFTDTLSAISEYTDSVDAHKSRVFISESKSNNIDKIFNVQRVHVTQPSYCSVADPSATRRCFIIGIRYQVLK